MIELPPWPGTPPSHGAVLLREFTASDLRVALEMGDDPYIPLIGSLPAHPTDAQALAWIEQQRQRLQQGLGFSFAIASAATGQALGAIGLWLQALELGKASVGHAMSPAPSRPGVRP